MTEQTYDVLIIGGSYAGLSAALALGRSLRRVLILDGNTPCNRQTPHSHNFLTQDGATPAELRQKALQEISFYPSVQLHEELAINAVKQANGFEVHTQQGHVYFGKKLILSTGLTDLLP